MSTRDRVLSRVMVLAIIVLGGCVFLPVTTTEYDAECDITKRHMVLKPHQVEAFVGCQDEGCAALLVLAGAVTATSVVISGSVAVIGEAVYWLEAKRQCRNR